MQEYISLQHNLCQRLEMIHSLQIELRDARETIAHQRRNEERREFESYSAQRRASVVARQRGALSERPSAASWRNQGPN